MEALDVHSGLYVIPKFDLGWGNIYKPHLYN